MFRLLYFALFLVWIMRYSYYISVLNSIIS